MTVFLHFANQAKERELRTYKLTQTYIVYIKCPDISKDRERRGEYRRMISPSGAKYIEDNIELNVNRDR